MEEIYIYISRLYILIIFIIIIYKVFKEKNKINYMFICCKKKVKYPNI